MSTIRKVTILIHEKDLDTVAATYAAWFFRKEWEAQGIRVELVKGIDRKIDTDILFPQVDLSIIPEDYVRYCEEFPRVVNRRVTDIRKSIFSTCRVQPGDAWRGRVIVKTDRNYGGRPELRILGKKHRISGTYRRVRHLMRRLIGQSYERSGVDLSTASSLNPHNYPIFDSIDAVPPGAFENPALIVERFLQEPSEDGYVLRSYNFLGDRWFSRRRVSPNPIVKAYNSRLIDSPTVPPKLIEIRNSLGFDYGKFDYLMHEGEPILLDINTTPTVVEGEDHENLLRSLNHLASGIHALA